MVAAPLAALVDLEEEADLMEAVAAATVAQAGMADAAAEADMVLHFHHAAGMLRTVQALCTTLTKITGTEEATAAAAAVATTPTERSRSSHDPNGQVFYFQIMPAA